MRDEPVDDPEVDRLRPRALARADLARARAPNTSAAVAACTSSPRSKISFSTSSPATCARIAQLDLRVVGRDQLAPVLGDEAAADLAPQLGADRDVLEVRVGARQPAGRGGGLVEGRVQAAGLGRRSGRAARRSRCSSASTARASSRSWRRSRAPRGSPRARARRSRSRSCRAASCVRPSFSNRISAELLRRADRELLARQLVDLALELGRSRSPTLAADLAEPLGVELHALRAPCRHSTSTSGSSTSLEQAASSPCSLDLVALARPPARACRDRFARRAPFRALAPPPRCPRCSASSIERVLPPRRVDQVGGDHRVVLERRRARRRPRRVRRSSSSRAPPAGRSPHASASAAERLRVAHQHLVAAGVGREPSGRSATARPRAPLGRRAWRSAPLAGDPPRSATAPPRRAQPRRVAA